ncbi:hypothetical protein Cgig2_027630 [Carnegiea gigantea]|uniref:Uncharacterized protein n=1 Tax=Carnegiea gigantea TaxID=171969 RepID=A0A9Q1GYU6_9CARY|nr:hypothetical protein Cgig2_027630 [Carnegiea gigantea]
MKKFYCKGTGTGTVHPSHAPSSISEQFSLSYLPAAILTIAASLSAEDKEVLAYLLSCSSASATAVDFPDHHDHHHPASSTCYCFTCYTTFWARWDSSPNRHLIHQIIDALEDGFLNRKQGINRRERRKNSKKSKVSELNANDRRIRNNNGSHGSGRVNPELGPLESKEEDDDGQLRNDGEGTWEKQGSVRKISVKNLERFVTSKVETVMSTGHFTIRHCSTVAGVKSEHSQSSGTRAKGGPCVPHDILPAEEREGMHVGTLGHSTLWVFFCHFADQNVTFQLGRDS